MWRTEADSDQLRLLFLTRGRSWCSLGSTQRAVQSLCVVSTASPFLDGHWWWLWSSCWQPLLWNPYQCPFWRFPGRGLLTQFAVLSLSSKSTAVVKTVHDSNSRVVCGAMIELIWDWNDKKKILLSLLISNCNQLPLLTLASSSYLKFLFFLNLYFLSIARYIVFYVTKANKTKILLSGSLSPLSDTNVKTGKYLSSSLVKHKISKHSPVLSSSNLGIEKPRRCPG